MSQLVLFYRDGGTGAGRTFEHVLAMDDLALEYGHDWVQWMFPLPEPSRAQPSSPVMTAKDIEVFRTDPVIRANVQRALDRFGRFLGESKDWLHPRDHNHLRITRAIRFLTLIGLPEEAETLCEFAVMMTTKAGVLSDVTESFWREALKENPAWL